MCGISGIIHKNSLANDRPDVGSELVKMLESMTHRGMDSCGITVAGQPEIGELLVRIWIDDSLKAKDIEGVCEKVIGKAGGVIVDKIVIDEFLRITLNYKGKVSELAEALLAIDGIEIHSIGRSSEVIKDIGTPKQMDTRHKISGMLGTHGIGHVRLATESKVDVSHSHPFWAFPFPDVTVVHNGQLTNYHSVKRDYEDSGHRFLTHNDSEVIAVYLADRLARGATLREALEDSLDDLDGTFTYLVSTRNGMGFAKDQWSAKPLVTMENEDVVAVASEEVALRQIFSEEIARQEPQQSEVMTWLL